MTAPADWQEYRERDAFLAAVDEKACPECERGEAVQTGPMCRETGHYPYACSANCGWSA